MKSIFILSTFILSFFFAKAQTETFAQKKSLKDLIATRHSSTMASYNGKLYFFRGYDQGVTSSQVADFWEYTPTIKTFMKLPEPPTIFVNQAALVVGNKMYVGLTSITFYEYNFTTGAWT